ncbi:MAG: hypothetical protein GY793_02480 [Proteobacteria bacterium]|nr:hypothetical protein [Pseudomonadota bacterium]
MMTLFKALIFKKEDEVLEHVQANGRYEDIFSIPEEERINAKEIIDHNDSAYFWWLIILTVFAPPLSLVKTPLINIPSWIGGSIILFYIGFVFFYVCRMIKQSKIKQRVIKLENEALHSL